MSVLEQLVDQK